MLYRFMGRCHARLVALGEDRGQGTIEYVGLMVLMATVLTGVVAAADKDSFANAIFDQIKTQIQTVGDTKKGG